MQKQKNQANYPEEIYHFRTFKDKKQNHYFGIMKPNGKIAAHTIDTNLWLFFEKGFSGDSYDTEIIITKFSKETFREMSLLAKSDLYGCDRCYSRLKELVGKGTHVMSSFPIGGRDLPSLDAYLSDIKISLPKNLR